MGHDPIKYALWVGGFGLAVALVCGAYVVWTNGSSRNLGLGLGALVGACVIFVLQIVFDLRGTTTSTDFAVEFVVDHQQKAVRSPRAYDQSMAVAAGYRDVIIEIEASKTIAAATPPLTKDDAPKIARDLGLVSVISYLLNEQSDWQLDTKSFKTSIGTISQWAPLSTPKECSKITISAIREKLQAAGNTFAGAQIGMMGENASLCLPPNAVLDVTQSSVAIRSFVCSILFTLQEPFSSMMHIDPNAVAVARKTKQPINATAASTLPDGSPRYTIVTIGARTTVEFVGLRAQDRNLEKYQKWTNRVVDGVKARFEWPE
jgi:hypothetical protein